MDRPKIRHGRKPESKLQQDIMNLLRAKGWFVKNTHGNQYQSGFPDLYACARAYGTRWIEVKTDSGRLEMTQVRDFHRFAAEGVGVWILTAATEEEYKKLFGPPNWQWWLGVMK